MDQIERSIKLMDYMRSLQFYKEDEKLNNERVFIGIYFVVDWMIQILLSDLNYTLTDRGLVVGDSENQIVYPAILFAEENDILSTEAAQAVHLLEERRVDMTQYIMLREEEGHEVLKEAAQAFDEFETWFMSQLNQLQGLSVNETSRLRDSAFSLVEIVNGKIQTKPHDITTEFLTSTNEDMYSRFQVLESKIDQLLAGQNSMMKTINDISEQIFFLSDGIKKYQDNVLEKLEKTSDSEEIEHILADFSDQCVKKTMLEMGKNFSTEMEEAEKDELIDSFGLDAWNKLEEQSKTFLITAKLMFKQMSQMDTILDYSGVCLLITKALELELKERFFTQFLEYLGEKYHGCEQYDLYPTSLIFKNQPMPEENFSLGKVPYILCFSEKSADTDEKKENNLKQLLEYCKSKLFLNEYISEEIEKLLNYYAEKIVLITKIYRNPASHTNEIKKENAEGCFDLVVDEERLLKAMLDSFKF